MLVSRSVWCLTVSNTVGVWTAPEGGRPASYVRTLIFLTLTFKK